MQEQEIVNGTNVHAIGKPSQRESAFVAFITPAKRVLFVRPNSRRKLHPVGGKCEANESVRSTILREVQEELSLSLEVQKLQLAGEAYTQYKGEDFAWYERFFVYNLSIDECADLLLASSLNRLEAGMELFLIDGLNRDEQQGVRYDMVTLVSDARWLYDRRDYSGPGTWFFDYFHQYPDLLEG